MERIAWRQAAVKDSSSAVTGARSFRRRARAAAASLRSAAAALARTSWVPVSQAQASWMTSRGDPDRSTGPLVRFPAPVIVALSSPNVVSDALHRVRYVSRTASAGAASWSRRVVITVQVSETSSPSPRGRTALCSAARTGSRSCFFPDGAFSQVRRDPSGSQPPPGASGSAIPGAHPGDDVPARVQDRGDQVIAGEIPVEAGHAAGEQVRAAARQPFQQGLLPGPAAAQDRAEHGPAGAGGQGDDPQLRERRGIIPGPGRAEHRPVRRRVRQVHQHPVGGAAPSSRPAAPPTARHRR